MGHASNRRAGRGGGPVVSIAFLVMVALEVFASDVLFPAPLHLTRRIEDSLGESPITVEEYCFGNRVVSVSGTRTVIADYDRESVTEIDRAAGTYSITSFSEIAGADAKKPLRQQHSQAAPRALGATAGESGRVLTRFAIDSGSTSIVLGVDHSLTLRSEALRVLSGSAYPARSSPAQELMLQAAGEGLPSEVVTTQELDGARAVIRNVITRVGEEPVPADLLLIPPGARRVESRLTGVARAARELDQH